MAMPSQTRIVRFVYRGWMVKFPTIGTNYKFEVRHPDKAEVKRFDHRGDAERWIDKQVMAR